MTRFIQLSDLHIHGSNNKDDNVNAMKVIDYVINRYAADKKGQKPIVLITGDITDDGKKNQYRNAVKILRPLRDAGFKVLACPGNHDYGFAGNFYSEKSQRLFQESILGDLLEIKGAGAAGMTMEKLYPLETNSADARFIGVDSVVGNEQELLHFASGEVGEPQREKLAKLLSAPAPGGKKTVVYFHHHPFYRNFWKKLVLEMDDAAQVMRILADRVDFVCFGHKHASDIWTAEQGIDWICASGKTTDRNERYKFQFREMTIDGDDNAVSKIAFRKD